MIFLVVRPRLTTRKKRRDFFGALNPHPNPLPKGEGILRSDCALTENMISFVKRFLIALIIIAVLYGLNLAMSKEGLFGFGVPLYQVDLWKMAGINIILAVSLNLINGFTGQFSIGHIGFMAVGAYSSTFMTVYYTQRLEQSLAGILGASVAAAIVFALVIIIGALAAAVAGLIVGIPTLRLRGDYLAIATLGFAEIIRIVITNMNKVGGATGFRGCVDPITNITCSDPSLGRLTIPAYTNFFWIGFLAVITIVVIYNIVNSDMGRALISIREDELAAQAMGVNTTRYKVTSFVISSAFAGVAGALYGHWRLPHPNDFTFVRSFEIIIMIVLGRHGLDYGRGAGRVGDHICAGGAAYASRRRLQLSPGHIRADANHHHDYASPGHPG